MCSLYLLLPDQISFSSELIYTFFLCFVLGTRTATQFTLVHWCFYFVTYTVSVIVFVHCSMLKFVSLRIKSHVTSSLLLGSFFDFCHSTYFYGILQLRFLFSHFVYLMFLGFFFVHSISFVVFGFTFRLFLCWFFSCVLYFVCVSCVYILDLQ